MGHYYAEMACPNCHRCQCECPPEPDPDLYKWIVDHGKPIQVKDFDEKYRLRNGPYGPMDGMPLLHRMHKKTFETKKEAKEHAKVLRAELLERFKEEVVKAEKRLAKALKDE